MLPLLSLGSIVVPTHPLFLLIAFWAGLWLAARQAGRAGVEGDHVYNAGLYGLIAGLIGARLGFVLSHWENYAADPGQIFSLSRAAFSTGEGVVVAALVIWIYLQRHRIPVGTFADALAPGVALALVIGRIGAFLGGEGLGAPAALPWAIDIAGTPRHPVQLYEAAAGLMILGILLGVREHPWPGFLFWLLLCLYSLSRLILEIFWARPPLMGGGYALVQVVALAGLVTGLIFMAYFFSKKQAM